MGAFAIQTAALFKAALSDERGKQVEDIEFGRSVNLKKIVPDGIVRVNPVEFEKLADATLVSQREVNTSDQSLFWASDSQLFVSDQHLDIPKKLKANSYIKVLNSAAANSDVEIIDGSIQGGANSISIFSDGAAIVPGYELLITMRDKNFASPSLTVASWRWGLSSDSFNDTASVYDRLEFVSDDLFRLKIFNCVCERGIFIYQPSFESRNDVLRTESVVTTSGGPGTPQPLIRTGQVHVLNSPKNYKVMLPDIYLPVGEDPSPLVLTFVSTPGPVPASFRLVFGPGVAQTTTFTSTIGANNFTEALAFLTAVAAVVGATVTSNPATNTIALSIPCPFIMKVDSLSSSVTVSAGRNSWIEEYRTHENMLQYLDLRILPIGARTFSFGPEGLAFDFDIRMGTPISEVGSFIISQNLKLLASNAAGLAL